MFKIILLIIAPNIAFAYIGPGMTGGGLAILLGIIAAIFITIFGLIYYPLKIWLKKRKKRKKIE